MSKINQTSSYTDTALLERYLNFCENYLDGFTPIDWQLQYFKEFICTKRTEDNHPYYRISSAVLPKKSGKTFFLATVLVFLAGVRERHTLLVMAQSKEVAQDNIFGECKKIIQNNDDLSEWYDVKVERITCKGTKTVIKLLSGQNPKISGYNTSYIVIDEYLELQEFYFKEIWLRLVNADMAQKITGGQISLISMPSMKRNDTAWKIYTKSKNTLEARKAGLEDPDPRHYGMIYGVPDGLEHNPERWAEFLPAISGGISTQRYFEDDYKRVKNDPAEFANFRCLMLGQFCSSPEMWFAPDILNAAITTRPETDFIGSKESVLSVDFGATFDLCSWSIEFKEQDKYYAYPRFMMPRDTAYKRGEEDAFDYVTYQKEPKNNFFFCDGDRTDGAELVRRIIADAKKYNIRNLVFDPHGMEIIRQQLMPHFSKVLECSQHLKQMSAVWRFMDSLIINHNLKFPHNDVLQFNFNHCKKTINPKNDELIIEKTHSRARIDGLDAIAIGLSWWMQKKPDGPSKNRPLFLIS